VFKKNGNDAHKAFVRWAKAITFSHLEWILLDNPKVRSSAIFPLSNGAGFNKNAEIPLTFLHHLGLDRFVIGTVTGEPWVGNPEPNIKRYTESESMVNWMGLPGIGAELVSRTLNSQLETYGRRIPHTKPKVTINLMATPQSTDQLADIEKTIRLTKDLEGVDRYELNISCPNTEGLRDYETTLKHLIETASTHKKNQLLYLKISPDTNDPLSNDSLTSDDVDLIVSVAREFEVAGYTTTNTTRFHDPTHINTSPGKGGASGNAVYDRSLAAQILFHNRLADYTTGDYLTACGGINSHERLSERLDHGAREAQIFTPLIFQGPKLLTDLKTAEYRRK